ncbi:MAG: hypothetical protein WAU91_08560 [Desulfatitalea sp.]
MGIPLRRFGNWFGWGVWIQLLLWAAPGYGAEPLAPAEITITENVVAADVEPIGANLTTIAGGTNFAVNNHVWNSGFEPMMVRKFIRIDRAGANWFEWDTQGGPGYWNLAWSGLLNGATVRFYRLVDANGQPLGYANGSDMNDAAGADHVVLLGTSRIPQPSTQLPQGGYIANDNRDGNTTDDMARVYIENNGLGLRFGDYAYIQLKTNYIGPETSPPDLRQDWRGDEPYLTATAGQWSGALVVHPPPVPAAFDDGGETCLAAVFPNAETVRLGQYVYYRCDSGEGQWYSQLHPGASYRVSVWLRQEGLGNGGRVRFAFTGSNTYAAVSQTTPWVVNGQWQQFTYDFVAPQYPTDNQYHIAHNLEFTGPGRVWIDNFVLYRNDAKHEYRPFTPHEVSFDEMMASMPATGKKPAMRFYGTIFHPSSITAMFGDYGNGTYDVAWNAGAGNSPSTTIAQCMYWAFKTGDTPRTRVVPYLTCLEEYTEEEWMALVEYLGVPYNPAVDTPSTKPYAYQRYKYRGDNGTPWTEEFREIVIELGNETWHQGAGGYGWDGWGRPGWVHQGGKEYGLFARYMFNDNVQQMPAWSQYQLGSKIKFALGANYSADSNAYGELAARQGADISYIGHANYVGPKWETNDPGTAAFDDHGVQMTLLGMHDGMGDIIAQAAATREALNGAGQTHYRITAYEGGPSGYWTNQDNEEIDELYGKSAAMGLAALDAWLFSSLNGYGYQCYLGFSAGRWWSSHTLPEACGFRPHAGWLALKMRNRYALGTEMVETLHTSEPTLESDGEEIPLISSYALRGAGAYAVFVLSRKLDGQHDGIDFGSGYTPVTLHLPFDDAQRITRYRIERPDGAPVDPRANNRESMQMVIGSKEIDGQYFSPDFVINANTGGETGGVPPGSINLFVFETSAVPPDDDPPDTDGNDTSPDPTPSGGSDSEGDSGDSGGGGGCFITSLDRWK